MSKLGINGNSALFLANYLFDSLKDDEGMKSLPTDKIEEALLRNGKVKTIVEKMIAVAVNEIKQDIESGHQT